MWSIYKLFHNHFKKTFQAAQKEIISEQLNPSAWRMGEFCYEKKIRKYIKKHNKATPEAKINIKCVMALCHKSHQTKHDSDYFQIAQKFAQYKKTIIFNNHSLWQQGYKSAKHFQRAYLKALYFFFQTKYKNAFFADFYIKTNAKITKSAFLGMDAKKVLKREILLNGNFAYKQKNSSNWSSIFFSSFNSYNIKLLEEVSLKKIIFSDVKANKLTQTINNTKIALAVKTIKQQNKIYFKWQKEWNFPILALQKTFPQNLFNLSFQKTFSLNQNDLSYLDCFYQTTKNILQTKTLCSQTFAQIIQLLFFLKLRWIWKLVDSQSLMDVFFLNLLTSKQKSFSNTNYQPLINYVDQFMRQNKCLSNLKPQITSNQKPLLFNTKLRGCFFYYHHFFTNLVAQMNTGMALKDIFTLFLHDVVNNLDLDYSFLKHSCKIKRIIWPLSYKQKALVEAFLVEKKIHLNVFKKVQKGHFCLELSANSDRFAFQILHIVSQKLIKKPEWDMAVFKQLYAQEQEMGKKICIQKAQRVFQALGLNYKSSKLLEIVGLLWFCSSYNQNVLEHCYETALIASKIASLLGLRQRQIKQVKKAAFFHDLGKVQNWKTTNFSHVAYGIKLAKKFKLGKWVQKVIANSHFTDNNYKKNDSLICWIAKVADVLSANRPGVRLQNQQPILFVD